MSIIKFIIIAYICYLIFNKMGIEKSVKFGLFSVLGIIPILLGFLMFDYDRLFDFDIINRFGDKSLIAITLVYFAISILIRMLMYSTTLFFKNNDIRYVAETTKFITLFYICCIDVFIYGSVPIIINYYVKGDFINFLQNSFLVWGFIFLYFIIWSIVMNSNKINKVSQKG